MTCCGSYKGFFTVNGAKLDVLCDLELPTKDGSVRGQGTFADGMVVKCCIHGCRCSLMDVPDVGVGVCPGTFTLTGSRTEGVISATVTFAAAESESKGPEEPSPLPELTVQTLVDTEKPEVRACAWAVCLKP